MTENQMPLIKDQSHLPSLSLLTHNQLDQVLVLTRVKITKTMQ